MVYIGIKNLSLKPICYFICYMGVTGDMHLQSSWKTFSELETQKQIGVVLPLLHEYWISQIPADSSM